MALGNVLAGNPTQHSCSQPSGQIPRTGGQRPAMCSEVRGLEMLGEQHFGDHSRVALQSSVSKRASSRSCFSLPLLNASLNMHI